MTSILTVEPQHPTPTDESRPSDYAPSEIEDSKRRTELPSGSHGPDVHDSLAVDLGTPLECVSASIKY
jgi:hypothetical protein